MLESNKIKIIIKNQSLELHAKFNSQTNIMSADSAVFEVFFIRLPHQCGQCKWTDHMLFDKDLTTFLLWIRKTLQKGCFKNLKKQGLSVNQKLTQLASAIHSRPRVQRLLILVFDILSPRTPANSTHIQRWRGPEEREITSRKNQALEINFSSSRSRNSD